MDTFTTSYLETALWAGFDWDTGEPLDDNYSIDDLSQEALDEIVAECADFQASYNHLFPSFRDTQRAGHDFCLTRNHHGAGFWDGDWPEPAATILTDASHAEGTSELYPGDDGLLYVSH